MEWLKKLSNAIDYIEKNLDGEICYEEAAKIACCSTYYFGRMFSYVAGISLSEYIRRRRMTQAAFEIQNTDRKVLEVALKYGYTSPTSFNRAFQNVHGISPISAKAKGCILNAYPPIKFSVNIIGGNVMPYRVEEKEAMRLVGIRMPLTMDMEENKRSVPHFWENTLKSRQFANICNLSTRLPMSILGATVCQNDEIYYYIAAATDQPVPEGMVEYQIPKATWVVFENNGLFKTSVQDIFKRFLTEWLPFSGYAYAELPDVEVYPISKEINRSGYCEVWIAVKKEKENETHGISN
ncbi:AraC family transcriptional regulator [Aminipila butyrica]|uniref:AraC family transcriptional regulator n=1 Tax=Aminipila butyrica TaxID=433296 RepID=A0A858BW66_9FIRM|nr:AraC family transcriptional regulator [Aminipila butyrica]QIB69315.1 AraC family transcriptional regulator [Aminipila butyrica]